MARSKRFYLRICTDSARRTPTAPHAQWSPFEQASYFVGIIGFSVLLTWLYDSSGASVLLAMIMHGADNAVGGLVPIDVETVIVEGIVRFELL